MTQEIKTCGCSGNDPIIDTGVLSINDNKPGFFMRYESAMRYAEAIDAILTKGDKSTMDRAIAKSSLKTLSRKLKTVVNQ